MMIEKFFKDEIVVNEKEWEKLKLYKKIEKLEVKFSPDLIDKLNEIRLLGNKASHYNKELTEVELNTIVNLALGLYEELLIHYFNNLPKQDFLIGARILSTLFPDLRVKVYSKLIDIENFDVTSEYEWSVFDKYSMALTKSGNLKEAISLLEKLENRTVGNVEIKNWVDHNKDVFIEMSRDREEKRTPIARNIQDCKRNFQSLLKNDINFYKQNHAKLIEIIEKLLEDFDPSEFNGEVENKVYYTFG